MGNAHNTGAFGDDDNDDRNPQDGRRRSHVQNNNNDGSNSSSSYNVSSNLIHPGPAVLGRGQINLTCNFDIYDHHHTNNQNTNQNNNNHHPNNNRDTKVEQQLVFHQEEAPPPPISSISGSSSSRKRKQPPTNTKIASSSTISTPRTTTNPLLMKAPPPGSNSEEYQQQQQPEPGTVSRSGTRTSSSQSRASIEVARLSSSPERSQQQLQTTPSPTTRSSNTGVSRTSTSAGTTTTTANTTTTMNNTTITSAALTSDQNNNTNNIIKTDTNSIYKIANQINKVYKNEVQMQKIQLFQTMFYEKGIAQQQRYNNNNNYNNNDMPTTTVWDDIGNEVPVHGSASYVLYHDDDEDEDGESKISASRASTTAAHGNNNNKNNHRVVTRTIETAFASNKNTKLNNTTKERVPYYEIGCNDVSNTNNTNNLPNQVYYSIYIDENFKADDEEELKYTPYLGEDKMNNEEEVNKLLSDYDTKERYKLLQHGSIIEQEERRATVKIVLYRTMEQLHLLTVHRDAIKVLDNLFKAIAKLFKLDDEHDFYYDDNIEEIKSIYKEIKKEIKDKYNSTESDEQQQQNQHQHQYPHHQEQHPMNQQQQHQQLVLLKQQQQDVVVADDEDSVVVVDDRGNQLEKQQKGEVLSAVASSSSTTAVTASATEASSVDGGAVYTAAQNHEEMYEKSADSFHKLWCRKCYKFDCNLHGSVYKPLQTCLDINLQREPPLDHASSPSSKTTGTASTITATKTQRKINSSSKESLSQHKLWKKRDESFFQYFEKLMQKEKLPLSDTTSNNNANDGDDDENKISNKTGTRQDQLTAYQKSVLYRLFQIYEGDLRRIATFLNVPARVIRKYIDNQHTSNPGSNEFRLPIKIVTKIPKKTKSSFSYHSVKNYQKKLYFAYSNTDVHLYCHPCIHEGICSEKTGCDCITTRAFCTMACICNVDSPNFFRGCDCPNGDCAQSNCTCHAANRECDPDLCWCTTCVDPMYQVTLSANQRCKNDKILMHRAHPVLIGKSDVAGFGLFAKYALQEGDYVGEYTGELISQAEADRRGQIYDAQGISYLFNLSSDMAIDAMRKGNKTRFFNHSLTPNVKPKIMFVRGEQRIGFYISCRVDAQSELFFDYLHYHVIRNDFLEKPAVIPDWMKPMNTNNNNGDVNGSNEDTKCSSDPSKKTSNRTPSKKKKSISNNFTRKPNGNDILSSKTAEVDRDRD